MTGTSQADSYRPLRLPILLVGDSKLGGISSTVSSYESLALRGYTVDVILLFREDYYRNWEYLSGYFADRHVKTVHLPSPPTKLDDLVEDFTSTDAYYRRLLEDGETQEIISYLDEQHSNRITELESMPRRTLSSVWWPFVQHGLVKEAGDVTVIDSAYGDFFSVVKPPNKRTSNMISQQFDGSASWWTQTFGHSHPNLALAAARAAGRYGHVMFPQATHLPALKLAEHLLQDGPGVGWATRVFYSDDGSTGIEIALKMALRAFCIRHGEKLQQADKQQLGILGLKGSYHGDTIGAMDACEAADGVYTCEWHSAKGYWFDPPAISMRDGKAVISLPVAFTKFVNIEETDVEVESLSYLYNVEERLSTDLALLYAKFIRHSLRGLDRVKHQLAALVLEPLVMGAAGMIFVDPLFQRVLVDVTRDHFSDERTGNNGDWRGLPVIFDEVFTGLYRVGWQSCTAVLGVNPDIAVYAKMMTGGLVPLAATLASESIFNAFLSDKKADALLHGHSYSAHAVGCEVAVETADMMKKISSSEDWYTMREMWATSSPNEMSMSSMWSFWSPQFISNVSKMDHIDSAMALGTVLAIKFNDADGTYRSDTARKSLESIMTPLNEESFGIHYRTLGSIAYFMVSMNTSINTVRTVEEKIAFCLRRR